MVENGDERYGATIHICTPELDRGETLCYDSFALSGIRGRFPGKEDQIKQVRAQELKREAFLLIIAIWLIVDGEIQIGAARHSTGRVRAWEATLASETSSMIRFEASRARNGHDHMIASIV